MKRTSLLALLGGWLAAIAPAGAQSAGTGTIEGRVLNASNGSYLTNARVTVDGARAEAFTDSSGYYRLPDVPPGEVKVKIFYTGLGQRTLLLAMPEGKTITLDVSLGSTSPDDKSDGKAIQLDQFVVAAKREMDSAAIAINEQRFADSIKNVVSTDAFGDITEGNIGEFAKFLPGVTIDYVSPDARNISVRGVAPNFTSITVDGNRMASAASTGTSRVFELEQVSLNNASRLEVLKSRTPEIAADALGGSVNLVPRSALERTRPSFSYRTFLSANGNELNSGKTRGPANEPTRKIRPGADFVYINPVTKNFGYTLSALHSDIFYPQNSRSILRAPNFIAGVGSTPENPYLRQYWAFDGPKDNLRQSLAGTADWRITRNDVVSIGVQWNRYEASWHNRRVTYDVGNFVPAAYGPDFTHGAIGRGGLTLGGEEYRTKLGTTYQTDVKWRHTGPRWKIDGSLSFSHATSHVHDQKGGAVTSANLLLRGLPDTSSTNLSPTVRFDAIDERGPGRITVLDATGANPIDLSKASNYNINQVTPYNPSDATDLFKTARLNARRELHVAFPFSVKAGLMVQEQTRDITRPAPGAYNFVGPDGVQHSIDDKASLYDVVDPQYASGPFIYGTPQIPWPDYYRIHRLFTAHPEYFRVANAAALVTNTANGSQWFRETISAAYLMGDTRLISQRLRVVGGVRFERTDDEGYGVLNNPNAGNGIADPVEAARARLKIRGAHANKNYTGAYPSLDASFNITPSFLARFAYARSIGRPNLNHVLPNTSVPAEGSTNRTITVTNTALKPAQTNAYDLSLEYYFTNTGVFSVGVFAKDFSDFAGIKPPETATRARLNDLGVPNPEIYADGTYLINTRANVGDARVTGVEFNYSQVLAHEWLPTWARSFTVFANGQKLHLEGSTLGDFNNFISSSASWGVKYGQRKFSAQVNCNYRGRQRLAALNFAPGAFEYFSPRTYVDTNFEFRAFKHAGLFINARNIANVYQQLQRYGPTTPASARTTRFEEYGVQYTFGVKGQF